MTDKIRGSDGKGAVEHPCNENEPVARISSRIRPILPHKVMRRVARTSDGGHNGADDNGDEDTDQDENSADKFNRRHRAVGKDCNG